MVTPRFTVSPFLRGAPKLGYAPQLGYSTWDQMKDNYPGGEPYLIAAIAVSSLGAIAAGYHGYQRTRSGGSAFLWGLIGFVIPVPAFAFALGQGYGKRKGRR